MATTAFAKKVMRKFGTSSKNCIRLFEVCRRVFWESYMHTGFFLLKILSWSYEAKLFK